MILEYLKQETSEIHKQVESKNVAQFVLDHSITKDQFVTLLLQNLYFYETLETALFLRVDHIDIDISSFINQNRSNKLKRDLKTNGYDLSLYNSQLFSFPLMSNEELIGAMYVCEGSSLGVMLVNKHLSKCPCLKNNNTHHFYGSDINETLQQWSCFREIVRTHEGILNKTLVLSAALKTFKLFDLIMDEIK